jgi:DNA-binding transcriptional LysR family regulator
MLAQVDAATRELAGLPDEHATVRLGWITSAGIGLVPRALSALRDNHPSIAVITREGTTPALVRALRAGTVDLALLSSAPPYRAPDDELPALDVHVLTERSLRVAVPDSHPLARKDFIDIAELSGQPWIVGGGIAMGAWPGLDERAVVAHTARDWLAKLHLVAAGCGLTTVGDSLTDAVPPGVRVLPVRGGSAEHRRIILAKMPRPLSEPAARVADALRAAAVL